MGVPNGMNVRPPSIDFQSRLTVVLKPKGTEMNGAPAGVGGALLTFGLGAGMATGAELIKGSPPPAEKSTRVLWVNKMPEGGKTESTESGAGALAASSCKSRTARPWSTLRFSESTTRTTLTRTKSAPRVVRAVIGEKFFFIGGVGFWLE